MTFLKYSHLSIPTLLTLALTGAGCKNDCEKAIDHVAHLAYVHVQEDPDVQAVPPEIKAEVAKYMPRLEQEMLPYNRKLIAKRFGARCNDQAFTKCVLATKDIWGVAECEHPTTPEELEEADRALKTLRDSESAQAKPKAAASKKTGGR